MEFDLHPKDDKYHVSGMRQTRPRNAALPLKITKRELYTRNENSVRLLLRLHLPFSKQDVDALTVFLHMRLVDDFEHEQHILCCACYGIWRIHAQTGILRRVFMRTSTTTREATVA